MLKRLLIILLAAVLFFGCEEENTTVEETAVPVKVFKVNRDDISTFVQLTGAVQAESDAIIYAKISEKIERIYENVGDRVGKNQIIAVQYNTALKQGMEMAKAALKTAESQKKLAEQDFERMNMLFEQKAVSPQQFDQAKTQLETAAAAFEQAESQLKQADETYQNSFIKAPFAGIVAAVNFEENQMVMVGQPVAQVVNQSSMNAKLTVSGEEVNKIKRGQKVTISFPSIPNKVYEGEVARINKALNPVSNSLEIEVSIKDADKEIQSGIFGKFDVKIQTHENTLVIPEVAVQQQTEVQIDKSTGVQSPVRKYFVFKIDEKRAQLSEIEVGIRSDGRLEVTKGLDEGDMIVVIGQNIVKNGDLVKIIE